MAWIISIKNKAFHTNKQFFYRLNNDNSRQKDKLVKKQKKTQIS